MPTRNFIVAGYLALVKAAKAMPVTCSNPRGYLSTAVFNAWKKDFAEEHWGDYLEREGKGKGVPLEHYKRGEWSIRDDVVDREVDTTQAEQRECCLEGARTTWTAECWN